MIRRAWVVARRELASYFDHPTAYVPGVAFLGISLFLYFRSLSFTGAATLRPLFDLLPMLFAVFIPATTMRSLSEERRGRTFDWLIAQPVTESAIVLGKFLGCWLFVLAVLAGTLPVAAGILLASSADPGIMVSQYAGAALLAAQFVATGLWASSVTRNQVTAFITASAICFVLVLIGLPITQIGLTPQVAALLARLSVTGHFNNVARGVIDLRDALYFLTMTALFLTLAITALTRERLSPARAERRRLSIGVAVIAAIVILINLLGTHIRARFDLTRDALYTLSPGTRAVLAGLSDQVHVKLFASGELPAEVQLQLRDVRDILNDMESTSNGRLIITEIDPDGDSAAAAEATAAGIQPVEFNVLRSDALEVKRGYYGLAVNFADNRRVMPVIEQTNDLEFRLASVIAGMTATRKPGVTFVTGYGAKGPDQIEGLRRMFADRYALHTLDFAGSASGINRDSTRVLVLAGPTVTIDSSAVASVQAFVDRGGSALILLDPVVFDPAVPTPVQVRAGLDGLLSSRGVRFDERLVFDLASHERLTLAPDVVIPYPLWPIAVPAGLNAITRSMKSLSLAWAGTLEVTDTARVKPIVRTTRAAGLRDPALPITPDQDWSVPQQQLAARTVAVAVDAAPPGNGRANAGRMVVVSDASFVDAQLVQANPQNLIFLANAIDWLTQDESLIAIRSKDRTPPPLALATETSRSALKWGNLIGVPLLFALFGVIRVTGRRRRAQKRWKDALQ